LPTGRALRGNGYIGKLKLDPTEIEDGGDQEVSDGSSIWATLSTKLAESGS